MGFLDTLMSAAGGDAGQDAQGALGNVLQNTSLGGMSGLLGQLSQGGLANEVQAWTSGGGAPVSADQIQAALGDSHIQSIAQALGIDPSEVASNLAQHLPGMAQAAGG
jgi:uncharacterized protein YidB (DUF937 family)